MADFKTPVKKVVVKAVKAVPAGLKQAHFTRNVFTLSVENHVLVSDILKPVFWTHIAAQLHKNDRVEVLPENGTWYAEFMVIASSSNWAKVVPLRIIQLDTEGVSTAALDEYYVKWGTQSTGFRVHRQADKAVMKDEKGKDLKFETAEQANEWIQAQQTAAFKALEAV